MIHNSIHREAELYPIWETFCHRGDRTSDLRLQGIFAGQLNLAEGPDYQGAEFKLDGKIYRGDVEIHRSIDEWYKHRHHLDRRYDTVLLHLVWEHGFGTTVRNSKMQTIETIPFTTFPELTASSVAGSICRLPDQSKSDIPQKLKDLALQRLLHKVAQIKQMLQLLGADQVLYILLMRILGSPANSKNFEQLSLMIPWEYLINTKYRCHFSEQHWKELFLQRSGLLQQKSSPDRRDQDNLPSLSASLWQSSAQRPQNQPVNQLQKLASWIYAYPHQSLYAPLKEMMGRRLPFKQLISNLAAIFGRQKCSTAVDSVNVIPKNNDSIWGQSQIIEIIGNVIIPFFFYESIQKESYGFREYIIEFYYYLPQGSCYGKLKSLDHLCNRYHPHLRRFYINQALLLLKIQFCESSSCSSCPLYTNYKEIDINLENI